MHIVEEKNLTFLLSFRPIRFCMIQLEPESTFHSMLCISARAVDQALDHLT